MSTTGSIVLHAQQYLLWAIQFLSFATGLVAFIHAAITRSDAFTAVDAQSKMFWVAVLAISTVLIAVVGPTFGLGLMFYLASITAVLVYVVDVRVRIDEILGRSWFRKNA